MNEMKYEYQTREHGEKIAELEQKISFLWRWCLINSILLVVFTLLLALR